MRTTRITLLVLLLVFAVASIGIGYALWGKTLNIDGSVNTGTVNAEWVSCLCNDLGNDPNQDGTVKDKDVGSTTCAIDGVDPQILHFTVDNGYPSYFVDCQVEFQNTGTIPVVVKPFTLRAIDYTPASAKDADDGQLWVEFVDGVGAQVDPGVKQAGSLKIHVEQSAAQDHAYHLEVEIPLNQWNEP